MFVLPSSFKTGLFVLFAFITVLAAETKLVPSDWAPDDSYGRAVAIDGTTAVVGAPLDDNENGTDAGAVYVFTFDGLNWIQEAKLTAANGAAGDQFGASVAVCADDIVVGAPLHGTAGLAYVFHRDNGTWSENAQLTVSGLGAQSNYGISVDIQDDLIIVGADQYNLIAGTAFIFQRNGGVWQQVAQLTPDDPESGARFGHSVAVYGDAALVGAYLKSFGMVDYPGAAYVFRNSNGSWTQEQKLQSWKEEGEQTSDNAYFGYAVDLYQDHAIIGTFGEDLNGIYSNTGAAYIFFFNGDEWVKDKKLEPADRANGDEFGRSVAIHNSFALVGAPYQDESGNNAGAVYAYQHENGDWLQMDKQFASDIDSLGYFGTAVAITTNFSIIGAGYDYYLNSSEHQSAYIYDNEDDLNLQQEPSVLNSSQGRQPETFALYQNYPNPFGNGHPFWGNPQTTISYTLPKSAHVSLNIYNVLGQKVIELVNGDQAAGVHKIKWNGRDSKGNRAVSGVYVYELKVNGSRLLRKMIMME